MQELRRAVKEAAKKLYDVDIEPDLSRPEEQFGDYSTNAALQLAKKTAKAPPEIARALVDELKNLTDIKAVSIAGPGFINFKLTDEALAKAAGSAAELPKPLAGQEILVEFGDPNPFKEMHIGHLYTSIVGDGIAGALEAGGAKVQRLSYHGDVGMHVAKWLWAVHKQFGWDSEAAAKALHEPGKGIGYFYSIGAKAYEDDEAAKAEIEAMNNQVYAKDDAGLNRMYELGKRLSFDKFKEILDLLSISYEKNYLESQSAEKGVEVVKQNTGKVFRESQGAIIYDGEKVGLHTRVFINSRGLPTYESKDLGLAELKAQDYPNADKSIIITAHEQAEYFKVMLAALAEIDKPAASKTTHLSHGFVSLKSGKMSSRQGNVYAAWDLLMEVKAAVHEQYPDSKVRKEVTFAAVKYAFLKHWLGTDIIFDIAESVSLEGSSGPYLQYAHARVCSILAKASAQPDKTEIKDLDDSERSLARKISEYPEAVDKAINDFMPHHVANYIYELAQTFNRFYEKSRIIGDEREAVRLNLAKAYQRVLKSGLDILNIEAPERM
jgi:arginyl-tRNA synthetase